jgi:hypothetical protein
MPRKPPKPEGVPATPRYKPRTNVSKPTIGTKKTLRTLINGTPSKDEIHELIAELGHGSDRACAIITAVMLESVLTNAILVKLDNIDGKTVKNLESPSGALGNFFSKIYLGYALALYDQATRDDLETIRKIRNAFAHAHRPITFLNVEVSAACDELNPKSVNLDVLTAEIFRQIGHPRMSAVRLKYLTNAIRIMDRIHTIARANLDLRVKMVEKNKGDGNRSPSLG